MALTTHEHVSGSGGKMTSPDPKVRYLFGREKEWDESLWTATDDRVRGGSSISHLTVHTPSSSSSGYACFSGNLDTSTLGGAGFASQRTKGELDLDLSDYVGLGVSILKTDGKKYLVTVKDEIPGRRDDGREMSGITWEAVIDTKGKKNDERQTVFLPWSVFEATYRGRPKDDAKPLNTKCIKRVSFMMRSFFDEQKGDFSLDIESVAAIPSIPLSSGPEGTTIAESADGDVDDDDEVARQKAEGRVARRLSPTPRGWRRMLCGLL